VTEGFGNEAEQNIPVNLPCDVVYF